MPKLKWLISCVVGATLTLLGFGVLPASADHLEISVTADDGCDELGDHGEVKLTVSQPEELRDPGDGEYPQLQYELDGDNEFDVWSGSIPVNQFWFWDSYQNGVYTLGYVSEVGTTAYYRVVEDEFDDSAWQTFTAVKNCTNEEEPPEEPVVDPPGAGEPNENARGIYEFPGQGHPKRKW